MSAIKKVKNKKKTKYKSCSMNNKNCVTDASDKEIDSDLVVIVESLKTDETFDSDSSTNTVIVDDINSNKISTEIANVDQSHSFSLSGNGSVFQPAKECFYEYNSKQKLASNLSHQSSALIPPSNFSLAYEKNLFLKNVNKFPTDLDLQHKNFLPNNEPLFPVNLSKGNSMLYRTGQNFPKLPAYDFGNSNLLQTAASCPKEPIVPLSGTNSSKISNWLSDRSSTLYELKPTKTARKKQKKSTQSSTLRNLLQQTNSSKTNLPGTNFQSIYSSMGLDEDLCDLKIERTSDTDQCKKLLKANKCNVLARDFSDTSVKVEMDITPPFNTNNNEKTKLNSSYCNPDQDFVISNDVHVSMTFEAEPVCDDFDDDLPLSLLKDRVSADEASSKVKNIIHNVNVCNEEGSDDIPLSLFIKKELIDEEIVAASQEVSSESVIPQVCKESSSSEKQPIHNLIDERNKNSMKNTSLASDFVKIKIKTEPDDEFLSHDSSCISTQIPSSNITPLVTTIKDTDNNFEHTSKMGKGIIEPNKNANLVGNVSENNYILCQKNASNSYLSNHLHTNNYSVQNASIVSSSYIIKNANIGNTADINLSKPCIPISYLGYAFNNVAFAPSNDTSNVKSYNTTTAHSNINADISLLKPVQSCTNTSVDLNKNNELSADHLALKFNSNLNKNKSNNNLLSEFHKPSVPSPSADYTLTHKGLIPSSVVSNVQSCNVATLHAKMNIDNICRPQPYTDASRDLNKDVKVVKYSQLAEKIITETLNNELLHCTGENDKSIPRSSSENQNLQPTDSSFSTNFCDKLQKTLDSSLVANVNILEVEKNKKCSVKRKKKKSDNTSVDFDENTPIKFLIKRLNKNCADENATHSYVCTNAEINSDLNSCQNTVTPDLSENDTLNCSTITSSVKDYHKSPSVNESESSLQKPNCVSTSQISCEQNPLPKKRKKKGKKSPKAQKSCKTSTNFEMPLTTETQPSNLEYSNNIMNKLPNSKCDVFSMCNKNSTNSDHPVGKNSSESLELKNDTVVYMSFEEHLPADDSSDEDLHSVLSIKTENDAPVSNSDILVQSLENTSDMHSVLTNIKKEKDIILNSESDNVREQLGSTSNQQAGNSSQDIQNPKDLEISADSVNFSFNTESNLPFHDTTKTISAVTKKKKKRGKSNGWYKKKKSKTNIKSSPVPHSKSVKHVSETNESHASAEKLPVVMVKNVMPIMKITAVNDIEKAKENNASSVMKSSLINIEEVQQDNTLVCKTSLVSKIEKIQEDSFLHSKTDSVNLSVKRGKRKKRGSKSRKKRKVATKSPKKLDTLTSDVSSTSQTSMLSEDNVLNHTLENCSAKTLSRSTSEETLIVSLEHMSSSIENTDEKVNNDKTIDIPNSTTENVKSFNSPSLNVDEIEREIAEIDRMLPSFLASRSDKNKNIGNICSYENMFSEATNNSSSHKRLRRSECNTDRLIDSTSIKKEPCVDSYTEDHFLKACTTNANSALNSNTSLTTPNSNKSLTSITKNFSESQCSDELNKSLGTENSEHNPSSSHDRIALSIKKEICDSMQTDLSTCNVLNKIMNQEELIKMACNISDKNMSGVPKRQSDNRSEREIGLMSPTNTQSNESPSSNHNNMAKDDIQVIEIQNQKSSSVPLKEDYISKSSLNVQEKAFPVTDISNMARELLSKCETSKNVEPVVNEKFSNSNSVISELFQYNAKPLHSKENVINTKYQKDEISLAYPKKTINFQTHKYVAEYFRYPFPPTVTSHSKRKSDFVPYGRIDTKSWNLSLENVESRLKFSENSLSQLGRKLGDIMKLEKYPVSNYEVECYHRILGVAPSHKLLSKCFRSSDKKISTIVNDEYNIFPGCQKSLSEHKFQNIISDKISCSINDIIQEMSEGKVAFNDSKIGVESQEYPPTCTKENCDSYNSNISEIDQDNEFKNVNNLPLFKENSVIIPHKAFSPNSINTSAYSETFQNVDSYKEITSVNNQACSGIYQDIKDSFANESMTLQHSVDGQHVSSNNLNNNNNSQNILNYAELPNKNVLHNVSTDEFSHSQLHSGIHESFSSELRNKDTFNNEFCSTPVSQIQDSAAYPSQMELNMNENATIQNSADKILSNVIVTVPELRKILQTAGSLHTNTAVSDISWKSKKTYEYNHTHSVPIVEINSADQKLVNQDLNPQPAYSFRENISSIKELGEKTTASESDCQDSFLEPIQTNLNDSVQENSDDDYVDNEPINNNTDSDKEEADTDLKKEVEEEFVKVPQYKSKWEKIMERKSLENEKKQKINEHLLKDCFPVSSRVKKHDKNTKSSDKNSVKPISKNLEKLRELENNFKINNTKKHVKHKPKGNNEMDKHKPKGNSETDKHKPKGNSEIYKHKAKGNSEADKHKAKGNSDIDKHKAKGNSDIDKQKPKGNNDIDKQKPKGNNDIDKQKPKGNNDINKQKPKGNNDTDMKQVANKDPHKSSPKKARQILKDDTSVLFKPDKTVKSVDIKKNEKNAITGENLPSKRFYGNRITNRGTFLTETSELFKKIKIPKKKPSEMKKSSNIRSEEYHSMVKSPLIKIEQSISRYNSQKRSFTNYNESRYKKRTLLKIPSSVTSSSLNADISHYKKTFSSNSELTGLCHQPVNDNIYSEKNPRFNTHSGQMHLNDRMQHQVPLLPSSLVSSHFNNENFQNMKTPLLNMPISSNYNNESIQNLDAAFLNTPASSHYKNESLQGVNATLLNTLLSPPYSDDCTQNKNILLNTQSSSHLSINLFQSDSGPSLSVLKNIMSAIPRNTSNFVESKIQNNLLPFSQNLNSSWNNNPSLSSEDGEFLKGSNFNPNFRVQEPSPSVAFGKDLPSTDSLNALKPFLEFHPTLNTSVKKMLDTSFDSTSQTCSPFSMPNNPGDPIISQGTKKATSSCLVPQHLKSLVGHETVETNNVLLLMLEWSVDWLVQQQKFHDPPPISNALKRVVSSYDSFEDYYNTYFPLMLLDTWHRIYVSWTHLSQASPYFCGIMSYSVKKHYVNVECQTVFNTTSHPKGVFPDEGSILMIKYGTKSKEFTIKILGYVTHVKTRHFNPVTDSKVCGFKLPKDGNVDVLQVLSLTYMGAYNSEDIDKQLPVRIHVLCNVKSTLKQNDAMLFITKSPLFKSILNPVEDGLISVSLTPRNSPEGRVNECVRDITKGILSPHPLPLLTIVRAKPESDRFNIIPLLIDKMKNTYKTKVLLCVRTVRALGDIAANICLHDSIKLVIINKRCDTNPHFQKYLIDELVATEMNKTVEKPINERQHLKSEASLRTKKQILKECDVVLSLIRNCHDDFMGETFLETESIAQMCCIVDEANLCTEPETLIPILHGISKLILIGDPDYPAKVLSKTANTYHYHRSFFNRAFDLDLLTE